MGRWWAPVAIALGVAAPGWAHAALPEVAWRAPEECAQAVEVREDLAKLVGDLAPEQASTAAFEGVVTRLDDGSWQLDLTVTTAEAVRNRLLTGRTCHEVTVAGVAVLALTIDPSGKPADEEPVEAPTETVSAPSEAPKPEPAPASPTAVTPGPMDRGSEATPPSLPDHVLGLRLGLAVDAYALPELAAGVAAALALPLDPVQFMAHGVYLPSQEARVDDGRGGRIALAAGGLGACYLLRGVTEWEACLRGEAGRLLGEGVSPNGTRGNARWLAAGAGVASSWSPVERLALVVGLDAYLSLVRDEFVLVDESLHETPAWTARVFVGGETRFR